MVFEKFSWGKRQPIPRRSPAIPPGFRVYAIGDVHGRLDLLTRLLWKVQADNDARSPARTILVLLGDLIDRGADSRGVIDRLRGNATAGMELITLRGNHEEILERILAGETELISDWLAYGGAECLRSYGLEPAVFDGIDVDEALRIIKTAIPDGHQDFLESLRDSFELGDYFFVHAGIRPGIPLAFQFKNDLLWIRSPFLESKADHGVMVVHGHSISADVEERPNRIGLDTGAYRSGRLSAVGLEGLDRWFIESTDLNEKRVVPSGGL